MVVKFFMRKKLNFIFCIFLTIFLVWFFLYKSNLKEVFLLLKKTNYSLILFGVIFNISSVLIRIIRTYLLIFPIKKVSFKTLFVSTFGSYFISTILPGRLGEIAKPLYIATEENISKISCLTVAFFERILDLFILFIFFLIFLINYGIENEKMASRSFYKISISGIFILILFFALIFVWHKSNFKIPFLNKYFEKIKQGFSVIKNLRETFIVFILSLIIWGMISIFTYFVLMSFSLKIPYIASFMLISISALGFIIPTPGGAGGVHKAIQIGLVFFYSLNYDLATAVSIVGHFFSMVPVALIGFLALFFYSIPLSKILNFDKINMK